MPPPIFLSLIHIYRGQKKQYDEQALCRFMGKIMYCLAFAMLLWLATVSYTHLHCVTRFKFSLKILLQTLHLINAEKPTHSLSLIHI